VVGAPLVRWARMIAVAVVLAVLASIADAVFGYRIGSKIIAGALTLVGALGAGRVTLLQVAALGVSSSAGRVRRTRR
jgi:hypothetical protein